MDSALKRSANPGFLLIAAAFFALPGMWVFYLALVTGYAHGTQGFYSGYKTGRFKAWQLILGTLAIYPLANAPLLILVMAAAVLSIIHFVTDEYFLFKQPVTVLTKILFPGFLFLLVGTLSVFFQIIDRDTVFKVALAFMILPTLMFWRKIKVPTSPESGLLILIPTVMLALLITEHTKLAIIVHLMGLMHFWSFYVEYYRKNKSRNQQTSYLKQCLFFLGVALFLGVCGWYLNLPIAKDIMAARPYFAWIIVHSVLSFRRQDIALWIPASKDPAVLEQSA